MAGNKEKITQYFSKVVVRTLRKDLETLKTSGGLIAYTPESIKPSEATANHPPEPIEIVVPDVIAPNQIQPAPPLSSPSAPLTAPQISPQATPPTPSLVLKQDKSSIGLLIALVAVILFVGGSLGYWLIYKSGPAQPNPTPSLIASPSQTPSLSPIKENPTLTLKNSLKTSTLVLTEKAFATALASHVEENYLSTTSLATIELIGTDGEYLTAEIFFGNLAPDSLKSFQATLDKQYALVVFIPERQTPFLGAVLLIKQGSLTTAQMIMRNWETANIEDSFHSLFINQGVVQRTKSTFSADTVGGNEFRTMSLSGTAPGLIFSYGFVKNYLVISTHVTLTKAIVTALPPRL